jgi:hypothetical protein
MDTVNVAGIAIAHVDNTYYDVAAHPVVDHRRVDGQIKIFVCRNCKAERHTLRGLIRLDDCKWQLTSSDSRATILIHRLIGAVRRLKAVPVASRVTKLS